jgi:tetratricopeptide (TPR) repeat protein
MRRKLRSSVLVALALAGLALGLGPPAVAQGRAEQFLKGLQEKADGVEAWQDRELRRISEEVRRQAAKLRKVLGMAEGVVYSNDHDYWKAVKEWEEAVASFERLPEGERTPTRKLVYTDALLELGRLWAVMGERERGRSAIRKAAEALARLDAGDSGAEPLRIRGGAAVAVVLCLVERPQEAVRFIDRALARGADYVRRQATPDRQALLATCLLAKAEVARATGDPQAEGLALRALEALRALRPVGNPGEVAAALHAVGVARIERGEGGDALKVLEEAGDLLAKGQPKRSPARAVLALSLAACYQQLGQGRLALEQVGRSQQLWEELFPAAGFPKGHPALILALRSLGDVLQQLGRKDLALPLHRRAWELSRAYYPGDHEIKLLALLSYGHSLRVARTRGRAPAAYLEKLEEAVAMGQRLYPAGHPDLAMSRLHLGTALAELGRTAAAAAQFRAADDYYRTRYRAGHPHAAVLAQLQGVLARQLGDRDDAAKRFREALDLDQRLLWESTRHAADAEALALGRQRQLSYHGYLSASRDLPAVEQARAYDGAWRAKGAVTRLLAERRAVRRLRLGTKGPAATDGLPPGEAARLSGMWDDLRDTDARLAHLLLDDREQPAVRDEAMKALEARHAELQRELARRLPAFRRQDEGGRRGPEELAGRLPPGSAFVDIIRYEDILAGAEAAPRYAAFVLAPRGKPLRAELGPAAPIDDALREWRRAVTGWAPGHPRQVRSELEEVSGAQGLTLRRLVWEPIAGHLPPGTTRLFLAPDGDLAGLPFAALPGLEAQTALLDEYVIAYVPHGPFLLESLQGQEPPAPGAGAFLALGGVEYDPRHEPLEGSVGALGLAQRVSGERPTIALQGRQATPGALCRALPGARDALIETHAFYRAELWAAEEERRLAFVRDWPPSGGLAAPRGLALGTGSPIFYTGLILAPEGPGPGEGDALPGGLIADLPLEALRSALLAGCDTGQGEYLPAEGVQSLQAAFHLAGCRNVIASLWQVPDEPTRALVAGYYHQLWDQGRSTAEALCLAQRELYHNPQKAGAPAVARGRFPERSHPLLWAGLVHSGIGQ